jgi:pSer/pThr/pTyr-binding forkhead associated (FHA) protein
MDFEIGIVCGRCDAYTALGADSCVACGSGLTLATRAGALAGPEAKPVPGQDPERKGRGRRPAIYEEHVALPEERGSRRSDKQSTGRRAPAESRDEPAPKSSPPGTRGSGSGPKAAVEARARLASKPDSDESAGAYGLVEDARPRRIAADLLAQAAISAPSPSAPPSSRKGTPAQFTGIQSPPQQSSRKSKSLEELMDQAKSFVCRSCSTPVPMGHKFCGRCGASVPPDILAARTQFFGQLQAPGKAKLILIRGEGVEGLSYQLNAEQHIVGRSGQLVFPDDPFVSPKHANLFYRNAKLVVRDEGSLNGVYIRVRGTVDLALGDLFLAGEQLFRVDGAPKAQDGPAPDGTYFYSSPKHQSTFRVSQILQGGALGMTVCARAATLQIGREGGDLNFPSDLYMSASHCKLEDVGGQLTLTDLNSRNGTYVRIKNERELSHGDYLFIGRKLLRVEITAA